MRQAGRYLPEYRAVRARSDFLTMVRTPELAVEVTLQPVTRYGVDAAIIFSDILVVPQAMGMHLEVEEGSGPQFPTPLRTEADIRQLHQPEPRTDLGYMLEALRLTRRALQPGTALLGFAGAPWTLAAYMVEGHGGKGFHRAKRMLSEAPALAHLLLGRLADAVGDFLVAQVEAGADAVQIFDSWAGHLSPQDFRTFALPYLARAAKRARTAGAPVIVFAPGAGWALEELADATGADAVSIDWQTEAQVARRRLASRPVALQGNFDPTWLYASPDEIRRRVAAMREGFAGPGYIANLGHGVLPDIPVEHVGAFIEAVRA
jgi:uroporphyrinogen decarboxylase